jgi:type III restriction enzyme
MSDLFFEKPILNSPYAYPARHWELDRQGQPTHHILDRRRTAQYVTPSVPKPKHKKGGQTALALDVGPGISTEDQLYQDNETVMRVREQVDLWRAIKDSAKWGVTPETAKLLKHWREHKFADVRPFFCQIEAAETAIWLTEVAPNAGKAGQAILELLKDASNEANPGLSRLALKLATGAGKTTVMAMLIAWQTINAVRHPTSKRFTRGFLIVAPGITIKDRLRVLQPNDPDSYYRGRELVPPEFEEEIKRARIVITNYHAFKLRERLDIAAGTRALLKGRNGARDTEIKSLETEGQMLQRVMPELMSLPRVMVINDEAHHCYREKVQNAVDETANLSGEEKREAKAEAKKNKEAARLWISGLEALGRTLELVRVVDLSATPFFLRGSGYAEGTLFPWTMSDFSLMDAIECGIVKLPRVPIADNLAGDMPKFRDLWKHVRSGMPKKGRASGGPLDPLSLPTLFQTALDALYGHYEKTFELWEREGIRVPPCFIVVCQNTAISKLVYDFISGFDRPNEDGSITPVPGRLALFRNSDENGTPYARPRTILVDSEQLESGEALDPEFRTAADAEIERFRREIVERKGDLQAGDDIRDADLLREVMNTVGKENRLGEQIRCVVSVSMLTEGWDTSTVTHVLGVRAFGTQLLCEQVIGRALRRRSYDLNDEQLFDVEYADVLGVPFDFNAKPTIAPPQAPKERVHVQAVRPERDGLEITFPNVQGYRVELPETRLSATFGPDSVLTLTPDMVGPTVTENYGIVGEGVELTLKHLGDMRPSTLLILVVKRLIFKHWRDADGDPRINLYGELRRIASEWLKTCLVCNGGTYPGQLLTLDLMDRACDKISAGITEALADRAPIRAIVDPFNPTGSTRHVNFFTSKLDRWQTDPRKCHVNWVILDSDWEAEFCRVAERHPRVLAYVKNHGLGFTVPYRAGSASRTYIPDYIVLVDDGRGPDNPLHLVVEIKGYRDEDAAAKATTMRTYWIPGVNNAARFGRWAFAEFTDIWAMQADFEKVVEAAFEKMIDSAVLTPSEPLPA